MAVFMLDKEDVAEIHSRWKILCLFKDG